MLDLFMTHFSKHFLTTIFYPMVSCFLVPSFLLLLARLRSLTNRKERFYSSKTRQIHATHLSRGDRLWSNMPFFRPMATIVEDTIDYGFDEDGAGAYDVIVRLNKKVTL